MAHGEMATGGDLATRLLSRLQKGVPLLDEPYGALAQEFGLAAEDIVAAIAGLRESGVVRMIGPVMDARSLGYMTTLPAAKVAPEDLAGADAVLIANPHISHAYV